MSLIQVCGQVFEIIVMVILYVFKIYSFPFLFFILKILCNLLILKKIIFFHMLRFFFGRVYLLYSPKKETQHVKKYNLLQIFNIILNTEISITLH